MHHANMVFSSFELEVVATDFIEKNVTAPAGIELETWSRIRSLPRLHYSSVAVYHVIHVFAMVIRSSHCFKIGSYKFLVKDVQWLTAYA